MGTPCGTRQGQRLRKIRSGELPPAPAQPRGARPRTFAPLPPPVCIWRLPAPDSQPTAHLRRLIDPRPSIAWRLTRGALLFFCAFAVTCLTMLSAVWLEAAAPVAADARPDGDRPTVRHTR